MREFIGEDDVNTFEGWMKYQAIDIAQLDEAGLAIWRRIFDEAQQRSLATPKVGLMQLRAVSGEYRYAVAVEDGSNLWLTLWVRRSRKGEFFVMLPRGDSDWDPHTSYHLEGDLHMKGHGQKFLAQKRQPLTSPFRGTQSLGTYYGHGPKGVGAVCDPTVFSGVLKVPAGSLGLTQGGVSVDLVEPGCETPTPPWKTIVVREAFCDFVPHVVITVGNDT